MPFEDSEMALSNINAISEHMVTDELQHFLEVRHGGTHSLTGPSLHGTYSIPAGRPLGLPEPRQQQRASMTDPNESLCD